MAVFSFLRKYRYRKKVAAVHRELGIAAGYADDRQIPLQPEARYLTSIGADVYEREQSLSPEAADAWAAMKKAASRDGVDLQVVSAYRSLSYQEGIVRRKLDKGQTLDEILRVSAAPGYSEHHSGCALDLTTPGYPVLEEEFEESDAFRWLVEHAASFDFYLSFPRDNPHGLAYEPWHWAWRLHPRVS